MTSLLGKETLFIELGGSEVLEPIQCSLRHDLLLPL